MLSALPDVLYLLTTLHGNVALTVPPRPETQIVADTKTYEGDLIIDATFSARIHFNFNPHGAGGGDPSQTCEELGTCPVTPPVGTPGAQLPITEAVAGRPGTARYIDPAGSDAAACTLAAPCKTLSRAQTVATAGDNIVVRGGTYTTEGSTWNGTSWTAETTISKQLYIAAYPNETPVFDGATDSKALFTTTEGSYKYATYQDLPCSDGSGITMCSTGQNLTNGAATAMPDQVWVDGVTITQVYTKAGVTTGKFYVDTANNRLYMLATDITAATTIYASHLGDWLTVSAASVTMKGLTVKRYSNTYSRTAVLDVSSTADTLTLTDMDFEDANGIAVSLIGANSDLLTSPAFSHVTINRSNWMGIASTYAKDWTADYLKLTGMDPFNEWTDSPQSGAIKTGRNYNIAITNSQVTDNKSHGLWFDQSNYKVIVAKSVIKNNGGNTGKCVFFEISDLLYLIDNDIYCTPKNGFQASGSSGINMVGNTIGGGSDVIGIYGDNRSNLTSHCADWRYAKCANSPGSDRWCPGHQLDSYVDSTHPSGNCVGAVSTPVQPTTLDWMPRIDLMLNNIIFDPTSAGFCSNAVSVCIKPPHTSAPTSEATMDTVIHVADAGRGIPATRIDCNVYANGSTNNASRIIARVVGSTVTSYNAVGTTQIAAWKTYTAGAPISIAGIDANSLVDATGRTYVNADGTPTAALTALHSSACATPTDAIINAYITAGVKHFGSSLH